MPSAKAPAGIISSRSSGVLVTPPGALGWNHLLEPDTFTTSDGKVVRNFKLNLHHTEAQLTAWETRLTKAIDDLFEKFLGDCHAAKRTKRTFKVKGKVEEADWELPSVEDWLSAHLMPAAEDPPEGSRVPTDPFYVHSNGAYYRDKKTGEEKIKRMRASDSEGNALDLPSLHMDMGSIIQAITQPSIFSSAGINNGLASISLKLQGIRIIHLEQFTGSGQTHGEIDEEDMGLLDDGVKAMDLSGYVKAAKEDRKKDAVREAVNRVSPEGEAYGADLDDEIPF